MQIHHVESVDGAFAGCEFEVDPDPEAGDERLRWTSAPGGRSALWLGERPLAFARHHDRFEGADFLRAAEAPLDILPPFDARASRLWAATADPLGACARHTLRALSRRLPPRRYRLLHLRERGAGPLRPAWGTAGPNSLLYCLGDTLGRAPLSEIDYGINGSGEAYLLRSLSDRDAPRVHALRKRARDGSLAPLVFLSVPHLTIHLLLDGHDRWLAATLEEVPVTVWTVVAASSSEPQWKKEWQRHELARAEQILEHAGPAPSAYTIDRVNRRLVRAFEPVVEEDRDRASVRRADAWDHCVRTRLEALGLESPRMLR